jgi:hypothetical protein
METLVVTAFLIAARPSSTIGVFPTVAGRSPKITRDHPSYGVRPIIIEDGGAPSVRFANVILVEIAL